MNSISGHKEKTLNDLHWVALEGVWEQDGKNGLIYTGREYDSPKPPTTPGGKEQQPESIEPPQKFVDFGTILFDQKFKEGQIKMQVEFDEVDHRTQAAIILQYDPASKDMLNFLIGGGNLKFKPGVTGYMYKLTRWASAENQPRGTTTSKPPKVWESLFDVGFGKNLKANQRYDLEVSVRGSIINMYVDGVQIGEYNLPVPSLAGHPCGLFFGSHSKIHVRNIAIKTTTPLAFVVMQFQPPEYEALFKDVIEPICQSEGIEAYRADSTYMPGLIIEEIKRKIAESILVIAEITPANPNVYYEVGFADALNKPLILFADRKEGLKPFDVRAYRTIFYENTIGGKRQIEQDLRLYLKNIMNK
jgi:hypothetical protein